MTVYNDQSGTPPERPNRVSLAAIIFAVAVVALLAGLLVMLLNRPQQMATTGAETTPIVAQPETAAATAAPAAGLPTAAPAVPATARKTYDAAPPLTVDPTKNYTATITTPRGDIVIKLRPDLAFKTVNSFVFLAREGFYDGLTWHRVIPDFVAQGGDPLGDGTGGAGYNVPAEFTDQIMFDRKGIVAMARSQDPDSASSQFFITTGPAPNLNNQYTIFGEVTQGQDIVDGIPVRDPATATAPGEQIVKITITES